MRTRILVYIAILALTLSLAACGGSGAATPASGGVPPAGVTPGAGFTRQGAAPSATPAAVGATPAASSVPAVSTAPTAVPVPVISIPTPQAPRPAPAKDDTQAVPAAARPTATAAAVALPSPAPERTLAELRGKIVFFSDRGGGYPQLYMMDADGSHQELCNCVNALESIVARDSESPDGSESLYVTQVGSGRGGSDYQIWAHRTGGADVPVTGGAPGFPGVDYDPTWSPDARYIAWVSETNGYDEIYLYDRLTNESPRLTQSSGEWYKHPTFSPDGAQIAYWTNVQSAERKQVWVMNLDGSGKHNLSENLYNDWDPIWVK